MLQNVKKTCVGKTFLRPGESTVKVNVKCFKKSMITTVTQRCPECEVSSLLCRNALSCRWFQVCSHVPAGFCVIFYLASKIVTFSIFEANRIGDKFLKRSCNGKKWVKSCESMRLYPVWLAMFFVGFDSFVKIYLFFLFSFQLGVFFF